MDTFAALAARANEDDDDDNDDNDPFGRPQSKSYADANELFGAGGDVRMQPGDMMVAGNPGAPPLMIPNLDEAQDLHQGRVVVDRRGRA
jgi:hypothetical protein